MKRAFGILENLNFYKAIIINDKEDKVLPTMMIGFGVFLFFLFVAGTFIKGDMPSAEGFRLMLVLFAIWGIPTYLTLNKNKEKDN